MYILILLLYYDPLNALHGRYSATSKFAKRHFNPVTKNVAVLLIPVCIYRQKATSGREAGIRKMILFATLLMASTAGNGSLQPEPLADQRDNQQLISTRATVLRQHPRQYPGEEQDLPNE